MVYVLYSHTFLNETQVQLDSPPSMAQQDPKSTSYGAPNTHIPTPIYNNVFPFPSPPGTHSMTHVGVNLVQPSLAQHPQWFE